MAVACGASVANLYYAQPLLSTIARAVARRTPGHPTPLSNQVLLVSAAGGAACCDGAVGIAEMGDVTALSTRPGLHDRAPTRTDLYAVVPDGVARVDFSLPGRRPARRTVAVQGNVAAVRIHGRCCSPRPSMTWYGADGRVIKRVAVPAPAPRRSPAPRGQRAPATPIPVTVSPRVGSPDSRFTYSFRVPVSGASYATELAGPLGCLRPQRGFTSTGGGADDVRGHEYRITLVAPPSGNWCRGRGS